jgi:hypothetical protein
MYRSLILSAWLVAATATPAAAAATDAIIYPYPARSIHTLARFNLIRAGHRQTLIALQREARAQQARDGGMLTAEHRIALQTRLDRAEDQYRRNIINADPDTVDGRGSSVLSAHQKDEQFAQGRSTS